MKKRTTLVMALLSIGILTANESVEDRTTTPTKSILQTATNSNNSAVSAVIVDDVLIITEETPGTVMSFTVYKEGNQVLKASGTSADVSDLPVGLYRVNVYTTSGVVSLIVLKDGICCDVPKPPLD